MHLLPRTPLLLVPAFLGLPAAADVEVSSGFLVDPATPFSSAVVPVDVDGDGDLDLLIDAEGEVRWLENLDGAGTAWERHVVDASANARSLEAADVDDDGDVDLVAGGLAEAIVYLNDGGGSAWTPVLLAFPGIATLDVAVGDVTNDGKLDVIAGTPLGFGVSYGDGTGGFTPFVLFSTDDARAIHLADVDGVLGLDVVSADVLGGDKLVWYRNTDGNGTFSAALPIGPVSSPFDVTAGDLDGDGDPDVAGVGVLGEVAWFENTDGAGTFSAPQVLIAAGSGAGSSGILPADVDGDGDLDLVASVWPLQRLLSFENVDGTGPVGGATVMAENVYRVGAGDLDGDGDTDLASFALEPEQGLVWFKNLNGDGLAGRRPGSALLYPVHRSGAGLFTVVSVTNTDTTPAGFGVAGGTTLAHFQYVNAVPDPADPFQPLGCSIVDRVETLTPADTLSVLTGCHNAATSEGYLLVTAQSPFAFDTPWAHDHLVGSELVVNASGGTFSLNAQSIRSARADGDPTDLDGDGLLDLDAFEYEPVADVLLLDSFLGLAGSHLALVNLTGPPQAVNTVSLDVWNDDEVPFSATLGFKCWFDQPLSAVSPVFTQDFLAGLPNDPAELDVDCDGAGDLESGWVRIESLGVSGAQGVLAEDGALAGAVTAGVSGSIDGGRLLWESPERQLDAELIRQL